MKKKPRKSANAVITSKCTEMKGGAAKRPKLAKIPIEIPRSRKKVKQRDKRRNGRNETLKKTRETSKSSEKKKANGMTQSEGKWTEVCPIGAH